jgi:chromosome transmission fidelity protein 18
MLGVPIHRLIENLSKDTASRLNQSEYVLCSDSDISLTESAYRPETGRHRHSTHERAEDTLWTDKYRPQHFTELLGDEVGISALLALF